MTEHELPCKYQDKILTLCEDTAEIKAVTVGLDKRINGTLNQMADHINQGAKWRTLIVSIALGLVINIVAFAYMYGQLVQAVKHNTKALVQLESKICK